MNIEEKMLNRTCSSDESCDQCGVDIKLMCRFNKKELLFFFTMMLPLFFTFIVGAIQIGMGMYILFWAVYALFFFHIIEGLVLCRHCPSWGMPGRVLKCHANYGVIKFFKYNPRPLNRFEKVMFIVGALILLEGPVVILIIGKAYFLAMVTFLISVSAIVGIREVACKKCINFSCPMNRVPKENIQSYFEKNPEMKKAWGE